MRLAVVASIGSYAPEDIARKVAHLRSVLHPGTEVEMFAAPSGVPYVESSFELYMTEVAVARTVVRVAREGYHAVVGTAFLDNGLDAARELVDIPVVGPAKTTMYMAATLAHRFAVLSAAGDLPRHVRALAKGLGLADRLVGTPALACTVAEILHDEDRAVALARAEGRRLIDECGAEAIVLGCGATTGLAPRLTEALGVPVLDPGLVAAKYAEMLVALGLSQSKLAYPFNPRVMALLESMQER
jgi:allantoin racemase